MNILLTGATGFLGTKLLARLLPDGHLVQAAGRRAPQPDPHLGFSEWPSSSSPFPLDAVDGADVVIHLAGEPVGQRWTGEAKERIWSSRIDGTARLVEAIAAVPRRPSVLVCASATGFYGNRGEEVLTEESQPGEGFLANLCIQWERAADAARSLGVRVVKIRTGIVLGSGGGALERMLPPFRMGAGGRLASGKQWMPWIHLDDIAELFYFAAIHETVEGAINGAAPEPVRNGDFTAELAHALHRPVFFPVPAFALKVMFGEMSEVLLASQRAIPRAAEVFGFRFRFPSLSHALEAILA